MIDKAAGLVFLNGVEQLQVRREPQTYFVAHEYTEEMLKDYRRYLQDGLAELHIQPYFADTKVEAKHILRKICEKILSSDFGVYDLSSPRNPNLFLELGIAISLNVPIIITKRAGVQTPVALSGFELFEYGSLADLKREVGRRVSAFLGEIPTRILAPRYCAFCRRLCDARGAVSKSKEYLIADGSCSEDFRGAVANALKDLDLIVSDSQQSNALMLCNLLRRVKTARFGLYHITEPWNPELFLQLGIAIGFCRPWLMVMHHTLRPPSDLEGFDRIQYTSLSDLETKLSVHARDFLLKTEGNDQHIRLEYLEREKYFRQRAAIGTGEAREPEFKPGDVVEARLSLVTQVGIYTDLGDEVTGVVSERELAALKTQYPEFLSGLRVGEKAAVTVVGKQSDDRYVVSLIQTLFLSDWQEALRLQRSGETFKAKIIGFGEAGLVAQIGRLRGLVPAEELAKFGIRSAELSLDDIVNTFGSQLELRVAKCSPEQIELVLSLSQLPQPGVEQSAGLGRFVFSYEIGQDNYDTSFSLETAKKEFLGECGMGISETIGEGKPDKVAAFDLWLFDKEDVRTVTQVLMSEYAYNDRNLSAKLAAKGQLVKAEKGKTIALETETLRLKANVVEVFYATQPDLPPNIDFQKLVVEVLASLKTG